MKSNNKTTEQYWLTWTKDMKPKSASLVQAKTKKEAFKIADVVDGRKHTNIRMVTITDISAELSFGKKEKTLMEGGPGNDIWLVYNKKNNYYNSIVMFYGRKSQSVKNYIDMFEIKPTDVKAQAMDVFTINDIDDDSKELNTIEFPKIDITSTKEINLSILFHDVKCKGKYLIYKHENSGDNDSILFVDDYMDSNKMISEKLNDFFLITYANYEEIDCDSCLVQISGININRSDHIKISYQIYNVDKDKRTKLKNAIDESFCAIGYHYDRCGEYIKNKTFSKNKKEISESSSEEKPIKFAPKNPSKAPIKGKITISESSSEEIVKKPVMKIPIKNKYYEGKKESSESSSSSEETPKKHIMKPPSKYRYNPKNKKAWSMSSDSE